MRKSPLLVLLLAAILMASGCIGAFTGAPQTTTVTKTYTTTTTKTTTTTESPRMGETLSQNLSDNPSRCTQRLTLLQEILNESMTRAENLSREYTRCLVELQSQENATKSLKLCRESLKRAQNELESANAELERCRKRLESIPNESAGVELLLDDEYYHRVLRAIENSRESVYVMMFFMKYDPGDGFDWANDLIRALVNAQRRGVNVHVLLDESIEDNRKAYYYLLSNGVDVSFDSPHTTLHAKVIVVDGKLVFIGSHNWSESALYWNHEVSVEIRSTEIARRMIDYFNEVRSGG